MFDFRNIKLALVQDDPLGEAFGLASFHRCQIASLLKSQLVPVDNSHPDTTVVTSTGSPGVSVNICEKVVPNSGNQEQSKPFDHWACHHLDPAEGQPVTTQDYIEGLRKPSGAVGMTDAMLS